MGTEVDVEGLVAAARAGRPRALGRLISLVENDAPELRAVMRDLAPATGRARIIGLTGAPGVGKSSTVTALITALRASGERVAVLAVDPTSPFSGGALLGDRVRMQSHALDPSVYIRSMATRGHLGGLAVAAPQALRVLDAAGFDTVLVETVGVGQSEVEVARQADVTLVLVAPGMGDAIQAAKAGILEIADVFVVNKADRDGAGSVVRELRTMLSLAQRPEGAWRPPIVETVAVQGKGVEDLVAAIDAFTDQAQHSGAWHRRRLERYAAEIAGVAVARWRAAVASEGHQRMTALAAAVEDGVLDAYAAADALVEEYRRDGTWESGDGAPPRSRDGAASARYDRGTREETGTR